MFKTLATAALLAFVLVAKPLAPAQAQTVVTGTTDGGAAYMIAVPDSWNGSLVIWNHGFSLSPASLSNPDFLGPLVGLQLFEGYAVAASGYQQVGWALFKTKNDLQNLVNAFKDQFGPPDEIILTGGSLGGTVTAQALEDANLGNVVGAYMVCGAVAGSRNWDGALDLRLLYDAVCDGVPGAAIPGGAEGLPAGSTLTPTDVGLAVNACTGILQPPGDRTLDQSERLAKLLSVAQIPENFLLTNMGFATFGMSDLVHDPRKLSGHLGTGNEDVDYEDAGINSTIARVSPNPGSSNRFERYFTPEGDVGGAKIVSLHTDKDGLVVVENESAYEDVVPAANLTTAIVVEAVPSHCGFTPAEIGAGWESLRGWLAGGPQSTATSIQLTCLALEGSFGGPCRIDPSFAIPDIDDRIRPR